jgi:para-nitrobenzyl esterase
MATLLKRGLSSRSCKVIQKFRLKTYLKLGTALSAFALLAPMQAFANGKPNGGPIVQTDKGRVQGFDQEGVAKFFGIPYAAPPLSTNPTARPCSPSNLRWCPPVAHASWKGVLQTTAYAPICPQ